MSTLDPGAPARRRVGQGVDAGVTEPMIQHLVHAFYEDIRKDPALGPIFNGIIDDWDPHLAKMCDFWSSVLLMTGRFKGAPMAVHVGIPELRPTHFARWLHLFRQSAERVCPPEAAALFIAKAEMIAESLQLGIAASRGELPGVRKAAASNPPEVRTALPRYVRPYRQTAIFTESTVPAGLLKTHTTAEGAWALIHVLDGRLAYRIEDPRRAPYETVLTPETAPGVVEPTIVHRIEPLGPVRFYVDFHRAEV